MFIINSNVFLQKPTALSAPGYHDRLFEWIHGQIVDESIFPPDTDVDFPKNFKATCKKILSRMFREEFSRTFLV